MSCVSTGVFHLVWKKLSCCSTLFYKIISFTASILDSPWWNNSSNSLQELNRSKFYSFEQEVSSLSSYLLPTNKKKSYLLIHNISHAYWRNTDLIFLVSSPSSTNTLRFPNSWWRNTILSKSSRFPMSSISMQSSSSLTIKNFLRGCYLQLKRDFLWK